MGSSRKDGLNRSPCKLDLVFRNCNTVKHSPPIVVLCSFVNSTGLLTIRPSDSKRHIHYSLVDVAGAGRLHARPGYARVLNLKGVGRFRSFSPFERGTGSNTGTDRRLSYKRNSNRKLSANRNFHPTTPSKAVCVSQSP